MKEQLTREPKPFPTVKIDPSLTNIDDIDFWHITLEGYDAHPPIKAQMAMVGGMVGRDQDDNCTVKTPRRTTK
jgi:thymidylate synthase